MFTPFKKRKNMMTAKEFFESKGYKSESSIPLSLTLSLMTDYKNYLVESLTSDTKLTEIENIIDWEVELEADPYSGDENGDNPSYSKTNESVKKAAIEIIKLLKK